MKIQIWYQDFTFNVLRQYGHTLAFDLPKALRVREMDLEFVERDRVLDQVYCIMNHLDVPPGHPERSKFHRIGHTSMSIGDFIVFEDEPTVIYICSGSDEGWQREDVGHNVMELSGVPAMTHAESWWNSLGNQIPDISLPAYGEMWMLWAECFRQRNQL